MNQSKKNQEALNKIAELANEATSYQGSSETGSNAEGITDSQNIGCSIRMLPPRLHAKAAETAVKINPVNAPLMELMMQIGGEMPADPQRLTLLTSKYWGPSPRRLTVSFMEVVSNALRTKIVSHMNAWNRTACISFVQITGVGQVRISLRGSGYWSYLGTDVLLIPRDRPTMNLQGFSLTTPDSEYKRVVRHETGHTMGFPHEHMRGEIVSRIDPAKAYDYFWRTQGWNRATVDAQVLTALDPTKIVGTVADQTSIMCYQLPASITRDGRPILGGLDINATDYAFAGRVYPRPGSTISDGHQHSIQSGNDNEWSEEEDVPEEEIEQIIQSTVYESNGTHAESYA
ncbi:MAG: peptidase M12 [Aquabacterium sp.]|nr:peptidase M12 [Ferruginibacter sp.]